MRVPKYRKQPGRDFAFVEYQGKRRRLPGLYNSAESRDAYALFVSKLVSGKHEQISVCTVEPITVAVLVNAFLDHAESYYSKESNWHGEYANFRFALRRLVQEYGGFPAESIGPLKIKALQQKLVHDGLSRGYANQIVGKIKRTFKWAASEELMPVTTYQALTTVPNLRGAKRKRKPVPWDRVEPVIAKLHPTVAAMLAFQWHTGARSGSICRATPAQFARGGDVWLWRPRHKTEHLDGSELILPIGPRCQAILLPFMARPADAPLFNPQEARPGRKANRRYRARYSSNSYRQAVKRAIIAVWWDGLTDAQRSAWLEKCGTPARAWKEAGQQDWTPHQIRHSKGHTVRGQYGAEAAQAVLGHESLSATQLYSDKRLSLAIEVARETG